MDRSEAKLLSQEVKVFQLLSKDAVFQIIHQMLESLLDRDQENSSVRGSNFLFIQRRIPLQYYLCKTTNLIRVMMLFTLIAYLELLYGRSKSLILKHSDTFIKFFNHLTLFLNRSKFLLWHQKFALSPNINMRSVSISDYGGVSRIETILPTSSVFTS